LLLGQGLERGEHRVQARLVDAEAQRLQAVVQRGAAAVAAHHHLRLGPAHVFGRHDLVGAAVLEHAVLVDARLVRERVLPDHRLVALDHHAGDAREQARGRHQPAGVDAGAGVVVSVAHAQRHHQFFQRAVAGALADAVDGALDLARAAFDRGQAVGHGQAQVVVAVGAEHRFFGVAHVGTQVFEQRADLAGRGVADGVGDVQRARAGGDRRAADLDQVLGLGAQRVLAGELDVVDIAARLLDRGDGAFQHLLPVQVELVLAVQRAGGDEHMDARLGRAFQRARAGFDVAGVTARQGRQRRGAHFAHDRAHALEVGLRACGEAGLDDVHAEFAERMGEAQLLAGA
ncbi:hypothetical protein CATMIT_01827, partial [Catenibacterium mitsuokai DSM 15897]